MAISSVEFSVQRASCFGKLPYPNQRLKRQAESNQLRSVHENNNVAAKDLSVI